MQKKPAPALLSLRPNTLVGARNHFACSRRTSVLAAARPGKTSREDNIDIAVDMIRRRCSSALASMLASTLRTWDRASTAGAGEAAGWASPPAAERTRFKWVDPVQDKTGVRPAWPGHLTQPGRSEKKLPGGRCHRRFPQRQKHRADLARPEKTLRSWSGARSTSGPAASRRAY